MNNEDLNKILKSAPVPERPAAYWEGFPTSVSAKLHWREAASTSARGRAPWFRKFAYGVGLAAACLVVGFLLGRWREGSGTVDREQFAQAAQFYREVSGMFPNQIKAIVFEKGGPRMVLSERADVPASPPYYVQICGPDGCRGYVTFSGQQISVEGEKCEVLADADGEMIVLGSHAVWSQKDRSGRVQVAARQLDLKL